ncbi:ribonuclease HII [Limibacillus halophilus]
MPDFLQEEAFLARGLSPVAGVDEVGRGPLAGPVVAAAVILETGALPQESLSLIADSKALSAKRREALSAVILGQLPVGLGRAEVEEIDEINILQASLLAMTRAVAALPVPPGALLVDGNRLPARLPCEALAVVKGDARCLSVACASIVAKVARDAEMDRLALEHPGYGWESNRGYGTADHLAALKRLGATPWHRRSFRPVRENLNISY